MRDRDDAVRLIAATLLEYLAGHPDAADSVEGIRRWWIPQNVAASRSDVEAALEQLVRAGELTRRQLPDRGVLYVRRRD